MFSRDISAVCLAMLALSACSSEPPPKAPPAERMSQQLPAITLAPGEEIVEQCQAWRLNNTETLYINRVAQRAGPGWHHSNWYVVDENYIEPPAELWDCLEHGTDTLSLHLDGRLLFASSVSVSDDEIALPAGITMAVPPRSMLIGNVHVVNTTAEPLTTAVTMDLDPLPEAEVTKQLNAIELGYLPLAIPPMQRSSFTSECDYDERSQALLGQPLDFNIYFLMPHYHSLGERMLVERLGDDEVLLDSSTHGEPAGVAFNPPLPLAGSTGLRFSCHFNNTTAAEVGWGDVDEEMCVLMGWVDSELVWTGGAIGDSVPGAAVGGVTPYTAACSLFAKTPTL